MKRRELCAFAAAAAGAAILSPVVRLLGNAGAAGAPAGQAPDLAAVKGGGAAATRRAVELLGGMKRFVRPVAGGNRGRIHTDFDDKIVDLNLGRRSDLVVLDATRILVAHGPQGGNLADVQSPGVVVAGTDVVAVDAYGTRFFDKTPKEIPHIVRAAERGLGTMDLSRVAVREENA